MVSSSNKTPPMHDTAAHILVSCAHSGESEHFKQHSVSGC